MRITIKKTGRQSRGNPKPEFVKDWEPLIAEYGFVLIGHAAGEDHGNTVRANAAFDDFVVENLVPLSKQVEIKCPSMDMSGFGEKKTYYQGANYHALFFYDLEKTEKLPLYVLKDAKGKTFGFYDDKENDLYLPDISHDLPNEATIAMVKSLMDLIIKKFELNLKKKKTVKDKIIKIGFGADPEFLFFSPFKGKCISAHSILSGLSLPFTKQRVIGWDGHNFTGELRPPTCSSPEKLVDTFREIFKELSMIAEENNVSILCGGGADYREPLGGHIHISNISSSPSLLKALDVFIGKPLKAMAGGKRPSNNYGKDSDSKEKEYSGSKFGFEYRTPPSWLTFPSITLGALKVVQILTEVGQVEDNDIPENFTFKTLTSIARDDYEKRVLKRYWAFIRYGDLASDPIQNWLIKESLLLGKLIIHDRTDSLNTDELKKIIVVRNKKAIISIKGRRNFIISRYPGPDNNNAYIAAGTKDEVVAEIEKRLAL